MTAAGLSHTQKLEIEWTPGVWTDVTADLVGQVGFSISVGRGTQFDDIQAGQHAWALFNEPGDYTPGNPDSQFFPNVVKGKRYRYSITRSAVTYWQARGWINLPQASNLATGEAVAAFSGTDALGRMAQRTLSSSWLEAWQARGRNERVDAFPFDDVPTATSFRNGGTWRGTARLYSGGGQGTASVGSGDSGLLVPGTVTLSPASGTGVGPVIGVDFLRNLGVGAVLTLAVKSTDVVTTDMVLATGIAENGNALWSLRLHLAGSDTGVYVFDEVGGGYDQLVPALNGSDKWLGVSVYDDGTQSVWFVNNGVDGSALSPVRTNTLRRLVIGGRVASWSLLGKQNMCPSMSVGAVAAAFKSTPDLLDHTRPLATTTPATRATEIVTDACRLTLSSSGTASGEPPVTRLSTLGVNALDALSTLVGTVAANAWHEYSTDAVRVAWSDAARPITSTVTFTIEADDDASQGLAWQAPADTRPTRVTASSAFGNATAVDQVSELVLGIRREESWQSCAGSVPNAYAVAGARLNRSIAPRIPAVAVDLVTAQNGAAIFASVMALRPGFRVTLAGLPVGQLGVTQADMYVMGWTARWTDTQALFTFDLVLADAPSEAILDNTVYGRLPAGVDVNGNPICEVTGGTAVGTTSTGTVVVATSVGPALTTDGTAYPQDWDWNGERVTVTSAPAAASNSTAGQQLPNGTFDTDASDWHGINATTVRVTTPTHTGAGALQCTTAAGVDPRAESGAGTRVPVTPGMVMTATAWLRADSARSISLHINYFSAFGNFVSADSTTTTVVANTYTSFTVSGSVVPDDAVSATVSCVNVGTPGAGKLLFCDDVTLTWATKVQTLTLTARGVSPTVARVHAAGEGFDVWRQATPAGG